MVDVFTSQYLVNFIIHHDIEKQSNDLFLVVTIINLILVLIVPAYRFDTDTPRFGWSMLVHVDFYVNSIPRRVNEGFLFCAKFIW